MMKWLLVLLVLSRSALAVSCDGTFLDCHNKVVAAASGETITWPLNGTFSYTQTFIINKGTPITIDGNGSTIQDDVPVVSSSRVRLFEWDTVNGVNYRMTNFKIVGHNETTLGIGAIEVFGYSHGFRLDHLTIQDPYRAPSIKIYDNIWGVCDHSVFDSGTRQGLVIQHGKWPDTNASGGHDNGDGSWAAAVNWGSNEFFFVEYNSFLGAGQIGATDSEAGGRSVFRHNYCYNSFNANHGTESGGRLRSVRAFEWYSNNMVSDDNEARAFFVRGGTGLVWGNSVTGFTKFCSLKTFRNDQCFNLWMTANGLGPYDGNVGYPTDTSGYPVIDQVGRSTGDLLSGGTATSASPSDDCHVGHPQDPATPMAWPNQASEPLLFWDNTFSGVGTTSPNSESDSIQESRDYIVRTSPKPGYTKYTDPHPLDDGEVPTAPAMVNPPRIDGVKIVGQTLTATSTGFFTGSEPIVKTFQWRICDASLLTCSNVSGATSSSYVLLNTDAESRFYLRVHVSNGVSPDVDSDSNITGTISGASPTNLIVNGGFEDHTGTVDRPTFNEGTWSGWTVVKTYPGVAPTSSGAAHTGDSAFWCQKGWGDSSNVIYIQQGFTVTASTSYPLTFWTKNDFHSPAYSVYDDTHSAYITNLGGDGRISVSSSASYAQTSTTFTTPSGCTHVTVRFDANALTGGGENFYLDDVEVVPPPVSGGSGGSGAPVALKSGKKTIHLKKKH